METNMDNQGWIKVHRSLLDWEWYDDINTKCLFLHLLLTANHKDQKWRGILIKKGERITSLSKLAEELKIGVQSVRTSLDKLKLTQEVTQYQHTQYTHISINNYDNYQQTNTPTNKRLTSDQHTTNNKQECKNVIMKRNRYTTPDSVAELDFEEIAQKYQVPIAFVKSKFEDVYNWEDEKPGRMKGRNWRATLINWVKRDAIKLKQGGTDGRKSIDARSVK